MTKIDKPVTVYKIPKKIPEGKELVCGLGCYTIVTKGCCVGCGEVLTPANKSMDSHMCKNCFMVEMAEIEAEDEREDSMTDDERLDEFMGS